MKPLSSLCAVFVVWVIFVLGCGSRGRSTRAPAPNSSAVSESSTSGSSGGGSSAGSSSRGGSSSSGSCSTLEKRLGELDGLILRNQQEYEHASRRAREACRGDSMVDCGYWSSYAQGLSRNVRDLTQEKSQVQLQISRNGC